MAYQTILLSQLTMKQDSGVGENQVITSIQFHQFAIFWLGNSAAMESQYACIVFFQLDKCTQGLLITVITKVISFKRRPQLPRKWMLTLAEQHHFLPSQHNQFCYTKKNQKILSGRLSQKVCSVEVFNNTILKKKIIKESVPEGKRNNTEAQPAKTGIFKKHVIPVLWQIQITLLETFQV